MRLGREEQGAVETAGEVRFQFGHVVAADDLEPFGPAGKAVEFRTVAA